MAGDPFCARLGIELRSLGPGRATTALDLDEGLTNFHGTPHGGAVYSLADAAFAAASNSHGEPAVALETNVSYLAAADVDGTLVARARETHRTRRTAEYEVVVGEESAGAGDGEEGGRLEGDNERRPESGNGDGEGRGEERRVATFRGRVYRP
ncbi:PaaI family thioesterase [Halobium salinum]|uniref:PaaI family thioesterase n=1 Tax=Halobium salinum TaxID=1364940 RepID=A0ABD5PIF3_9EURY